jgi:hypothetical protein
MQQLVNSVMGGNGLVVTMASGGGVYADVADHCGNFNAAVTLDQINYGGMTVGPINAKMATESAVSPAYLDVLGGAVSTAGAPTGAGGQIMPISDFYGYIIDLAFRTNAVDSWLKLQPTAVDRIYNGNEANEDTMGGGSAMIFKSADTNFTAARMIELMKHLRAAGVQIEALVEYTALVQQGDQTQAQRKNLLLEQREQLERRIAEMQQSLERLNKRLEWYDRCEGCTISHIRKLEQQRKG